MQKNDPKERDKVEFMWQLVVVFGFVFVFIMASIVEKPQACLQQVCIAIMAIAKPCRKDGLEQFHSQLPLHTSMRWALCSMQKGCRLGWSKRRAHTILHHCIRPK